VTVAASDAIARHDASASGRLAQVPEGVGTDVVPLAQRREEVLVALGSSSRELGTAKGASSGDTLLVPERLELVRRRGRGDYRRISSMVARTSSTEFVGLVDEASSVRGVGRDEITSTNVIAHDS